jgi:hypothetical protein
VKRWVLVAGRNTLCLEQGGHRLVMTLRSRATLCSVRQNRRFAGSLGIFLAIANSVRDD